jgi:hypothetical protein
MRLNGTLAFGLLRLCHMTMALQTRASAFHHDEIRVCVKRASPIALGPQTSLAHAPSG